MFLYIAKTVGHQFKLKPVQVRSPIFSLLSFYIHVVYIYIFPLPLLPFPQCKLPLYLVKEALCSWIPLHSKRLFLSVFFLPGTRISPSFSFTVNINELVHPLLFENALFIFIMHPFFISRKDNNFFSFFTKSPKLDRPPYSHHIHKKGVS